MADLTLIAGVLGAILGGASGAGIGYFMASPRPNMRIASIDLTPVQPDIGNKAALARTIIERKAGNFHPANQEVLQASRDSDYTDTLDAHYQHTSQYTFALLECKRDNERVRLVHKGIPEILKELKRTLYGDLIEEFLLIWHRAVSIRMRQIFCFFKLLFFPRLAC